MQDTCTPEETELSVHMTTSNVVVVEVSQQQNQIDWYRSESSIQWKLFSEIWPAQEG